MGQEDNKSPQDDQAWFDALSGKTESGQATRLRHMLREVELADAAQEDTTHDWQRLQFALRREKAQPGGQSRTGLRYFAIAASVLIVVGTVSMLIPRDEISNSSSPEAVTRMRGTSEQVLFSATPEQDAKQLESDLVRLGVKVVKNALTEKIELHIALTYPVKDEVRAVLEARNIPVPDQGDLAVVFFHAN